MKKDFYIYKCLREIHRLNQSVLLKKEHQGILLILNTPGSLEHFMVHADPGKIQKIFDSLINHLINHLEKGSIEFGYKLGREDQLSFYVKEPLRAASYDSKTEQEYYAEADLISGISEILSGMGGRIWIEKKPGACRTFWFTVNILPPGRRRQANESPPGSRYPDWSGRSILIVDDVPTNLLLLESYLSPTNARIISVDNGLKAIHSVQKDHSIGLVLIDVRMPVLDGYEATRRIKNLKPWLPVVALSAYPESAETEKWKRAGCDAFLGKPLDSNDLIRTMGYLFEKASMQA